MVSQECSDYVVREAIRSGVLGYVSKTEMGGQFISAIEAALRGERFVLGILDEGIKSDA